MRQYVALDNCLSPRLKGVLNALYERSGFDFIHVKEDLGAGDKDDEFWADRYRRFGGTYVLSGDCNIAYRPHQHAAFLDNGLITYFPSGAWSGLKVYEQAAVITHAWHGIMPHLPTNDGPACWRFECEGKSGDVRLRAPTFTKLVVPPKVLEIARRGNAGVPS